MFIEPWAIFCAVKFLNELAHDGHRSSPISDQKPRPSRNVHGPGLKPGGTFGNFYNGGQTIFGYILSFYVILMIFTITVDVA